MTMTKRQVAAAAPTPLAEYAQHFDDVFSKLNQREAFRRYLEGLLLPPDLGVLRTANWQRPAWKKSYGWMG